MEDPFERLREAIAADHRRTDEVAESMQTLRVELRSHTESVAAGLWRDLVSYTDEKFRENRRHFQVLAEDLRSDIRLVAEGVVTLDENVDRGFEGVRREMSEGFSELKALFRVAFADHERRIRALEQR